MSSNTTASREQNWKPTSKNETERNLQWTTPNYPTKWLLQKKKKKLDLSSAQKTILLYSHFPEQNLCSKSKNPLKVIQ